MTSLSSGRVKLRAWNSGDEDSLVKYANNRKVSIYLRDRFPHPYTSEDARFWIENVNGSPPQTSFAIEVNEHAVGGIGLMIGTDIFRRSAELGYWLGEPYWGKGLMSEAIQLITDYGFSKLEPVRIHAGVFETNPPSARVLEKAGYTLESRMKKSVFKEGAILDQLLYVKVQ